MHFAWDPSKSVANLAKHGVSFEEALSVFLDPLSLTIPDPVHSIDEQRLVIMGLSDGGRLLVVANPDDRESVRIISAREATPTERKAYEEGGR